MLLKITMWSLINACFCAKVLDPPSDWGTD